MNPIHKKRQVSYDLDIVLLDIYPWKITASVNKKQVQVTVAYRKKTENKLYSNVEKLEPSYNAVNIV